MDLFINYGLFCLFERQSDREKRRHTEIDLSLLAHSEDGCTGQVWARLKLVAWHSIWGSFVGGRGGVNRLCPSTSLARSWIGVKVLLELKLVSDMD